MTTTRTSIPKDQFNRYLWVSDRLRDRYGHKEGPGKWTVIAWNGFTPTRFTVLEALAALRYLGIKDTKVFG